MMMEEGPTIREQAQEFKLRTMELQDWLEDLCETFGNFTYNEIITPWCGYDLVPGRVRGPDGVCISDCYSGSRDLQGSYSEDRKLVPVTAQDRNRKEDPYGEGAMA